MALSVGCRAGILVDLGEKERGRREAYEVAKALRSEIARTGRADLQSALNYVAGLLGEKE